MHDRSKWTRGSTGDHTIKNRPYKNLTEFSRRCATCDGLFSIFVTSKIADGHADSNSFGLKNCPNHRRAPIRTDDAETERLRMANRVMSEELEGFYARDRELFAENQALKARLAIHEPSSVPTEWQKTNDAHLIARQNKMPWEQNSS